MKEDIEKPRVAFAVTSRKFFHQAIDFLGFTGESKAFKKVSKGTDEIFFVEIQLVNICVHDFFVELFWITQKITNYCLIQPFFRHQESSYINSLFSKKLLRLQILQSSSGFPIKPRSNKSSK